MPLLGLGIGEESKEDRQQGDMSAEGGAGVRFLKGKYKCRISPPLRRLIIVDTDYRRPPQLDRGPGHIRGGTKEVTAPLAGVALFAIGNSTDF